MEGRFSFMVIKIFLIVIISILYTKIFTCFRRINITQRGLSESLQLLCEDKKIRILLLIPVLREQNVIIKTLEHFRNLRTDNAEILVCVAGTSREKSQKPERISTGEVVAKWIESNPALCKFRYTEINEAQGDRASQLNFAVRKNENFSPDIIGVYDADSLPDSETLNEIAVRWSISRDTVFQQPVHFIEAANRMANASKNPVLVANALYQTTWTVIREYPIWYQHHNSINLFHRNDYLIGHGEFIPYHIYTIYDFPEDQVTDGIQLGYRLSMSGIDICPLKSFCSDDVPQSFGQLIEQHKRWFGGCNRLIEAYKWCLQRFNKASFMQVIDGFYSQFSWAFAGLTNSVGIILSVISIINNDFLLAFWEFAGLLIYCYVIPYIAHKVLPVKINVRFIDWLSLPVAIFLKGVGPNLYFFQRILSLFSKNEIHYSKVER